MTRRIVFAGGIQAQALARAYRLDAAGTRDEDVFFIGADFVRREAAHRVIAAADIVLTDMDEHGATVPDSLVPARAVLVGVPVLRADFLWPFAGRPHPANRPVDALPDGPYPADFGDSHLDGLLAQGVPPDEAVRRYLDADVAQLTDLDGLLAATLQVQARLDARTGFDLAPMVDDHFRDGTLFASRHRMRPRLFRHLAAHVFARAGADPTRAGALDETHFPPGEMPIHPSILRHFSVTAPAPGHRYPVLDEGDFTFEEYCRRYVRYAWNERLHQGLALADISPSDAIDVLRLALRDSPGSRAGRAALERAEKAVLDRPTLPSAAGSAVAPAPPDRGSTTVTSATLAPATRSPAALPSVPGPGSPERPALVELPLAYDGHQVAASSAPGRDSAPRPQEMIEVLPRMLASTRGLATAEDGPFATMEETMPPPPLRPVLPPEIQAGPARRGLLARLFGGAG